MPKRKMEQEQSNDVSLESTIESLRAELEQLRTKDQLVQDRMRVEKVIAAISTDFISLTLDQIESGIQRSLKEVLHVSGVDRCSIIEISADGKMMNSTYESLKTGIKSSRENLSNISMSEFGWGLKQLQKNDTLYFNSQKTIPSEAVGELKLAKNYGIKSFLSIGLKYNGELIGFMAFDSITESRVWSDEEVLLYKILGQVFANAIVRFRTETAARENGQKFRALAESSASGIFITHGELFTYVNPEAEKMTGYSRTELLSMNFWEFIHPDYCEPAKNSVLKRLTGESVSNKYELKILTKSGEERWFELSAAVIDYNGKKSILGTTFDVTDRKRTEEALQNSENRYKDLIQNANDIIYTHDLSGNFTSLNNAGQRILGYSEEDVHRTSIGDVLTPEWLELARQMMAKKKNSTDTTVYEIEVISKSGKPVLLELSTRLITSGGVPVGIQGIGRDITERRRTERELAAWKTRYEFILEASNQLVFEFNYTKGNTVWGGNLEKVLSYKPTEIGGSEEKWVSLIHPDDRSFVIETFTNSRNNLTSHNISYRFRKKNGDFIWLQDVGFTRKEQYFGDIMILGVLQDITAEKHAEEALKKSEERYRLLFERNLSGVYRSTLKGELLDCNDAFLKMLGFATKEEFQQQNTASIYTSDRPRSQFIEDLKTYKNLTNYELMLQKKDGSLIWALENVSLVESDFYPEPIIEGTIIDISQRKQTEDDLAKEKERLSVTLTSIEDGVITLDTTGKIVLINKSAERILGVQQKTAVGVMISDLYTVTDRTTGMPVESSPKDVLNNPSVAASNNHLLLNTTDGHTKIIEDYATPLYDKSSKLLGVVLVFRDITEKTRMEEELLKSKKIESIGILAGGIAHDFNNILTAILGNISLTKLKLNTESKDKIDARLSEAEKATLRAKDLTQQLLTFSKGGTPVKKIISLVDLLKDNAAFVLTGTNVKCEFDIASDLWHTEADEGQISQVINNLVINAQQAMPSGGKIKLSAHNVLIDESVRNGLPLNYGNYLKITVTDRGTGIPEEYLPKIFDPYFTTKQKGSGLGLATSYSILKQHNGHIGVTSKIGSGTEFTVYLPASDQKMNEHSRIPSAKVSGKGRILVMDDEPMIREMIADLLDHAGFHVDTSADGHDAVEQYKKAMTENSCYSAVIVDLTVPGGMGGEETLLQLKKIDPQVKVIVSSGYSNDRIMSEYKDFGFKGVVSKPYKLDELTKELMKVLNS